MFNYIFVLDNYSFELELEDLTAPPPLSQSAPELGTQLPVAPLMRSAVSSTELLYEKAMARLYQAVEYEESENATKFAFGSGATFFIEYVRNG